MILPAIPNDAWDITKEGAVGDGTTLNTVFIQKAIDTAVVQGGGWVVIPRGTFLTGSLVLRSGIGLRLEEGAVLLGSTDWKDYRKLSRWRALILAEDSLNIAVTGRGTICGQGQRLALNMREQHFAGELPKDWFNARRQRIYEDERPQILEFVRCQRVLVADVRIEDSASWVQTYSFCQDVTLRRITVNSDAYWNNDGIDIDDSRNVLVEDCDVNAADDGICLKSDSASGGCDNVIITRCRIRSSASGVKLGTASWGGFRRIQIRDITVYDTYRSAVALEAVDGGPLEDIEVSDITAFNTGNAFFIRLGHRNKTEAYSTVRQVRIRRIRAEVPLFRGDQDYDLRGPGLDFFHNAIPASVTGIPGHQPEDVVIDDVEIGYPGRGNPGMASIPLNGLSRVPENIEGYPEYTMFEELPAWGLYVRHVSGLTLSNLRFRVKEEDFRPACVFDDVTGLKLSDIRVYGTAVRDQLALRDAPDAELTDCSDLGCVVLPGVLHT